VHRSGRTARAGAAGIVVTLHTPEQARDVRALMRKAAVVPLIATVRPDSALVSSIAGPPAERVAPPRLTASQPMATQSARANGRRKPASAPSAPYRGDRRPGRARTGNGRTRAGNGQWPTRQAQG
jgi:superfamily II DNA/RNA helicase